MHLTLARCEPGFLFLSFFAPFFGTCKFLCFDHLCRMGLGQCGHLERIASRRLLSCEIYNHYESQMVHYFIGKSTLQHFEKQNSEVW